jgi:hypothetical protein
MSAAQETTNIYQQLKTGKIRARSLKDGRLSPLCQLQPAPLAASCRLDLSTNRAIASPTSIPNIHQPCQKDVRSTKLASSAIASPTSTTVSALVSAIWQLQLHSRTSQDSARAASIRVRCALGGVATRIFRWPSRSTAHRSNSKFRNHAETPENDGGSPGRCQVAPFGANRLSPRPWGRPWLPMARESSPGERWEERAMTAPSRWRQR